MPKALPIFNALLLLIMGIEAHAFSDTLSSGQNRPLLPPIYSNDYQGMHLFAIPVAGFNMNDRFMAGIAVFNKTTPQLPLALKLLPLWGFTKKDLTGQATLAYTFELPFSKEVSITPESNIRKYSLLPGNSEFSFFAWENSLKFLMETGWELDLSTRNISRDALTFGEQGVVVARRHYTINTLNVSYQNREAFNPYAVGAEIVQHKNIVRTSLVFKMLMPFQNQERGLHIRLFGGFFPAGPGSTFPETDLRFRLQNTTGMRDSGFEYLFVGRSETAGTLWGNQVYEAHGGFKYPTPLGQNWDWLVSLNLKGDLPVLPLRAYLDTGTYHDAGNSVTGAQKYPWVVGLQLYLLQDLVQVNLPLFVSEDLKRVAGLNQINEWEQTITFTLAFQRLDAVQSFISRRMVIK